MDDPAIYIYLLFFLLLLSGFFSGAEIALFSLSQARIHSLVEQKKKHAVVLEHMRANQQKIVVTILIGKSLVNVTAVALATFVAIYYFGSLGVLIALAGMTFLLLLFGEIIPKSFAQQNAERIALSIIPLLRLLTWLLYPVVFIMNMITTSIQRVFHIKDSAFIVSEEDVRAMVTMGHEEGTLESTEKEMIEKVFLMNDITAEDVMTPDEYIVGFSMDMPLREAVPIMHQSGFSRFPVFSNTDNDVHGIVYLKDVFVLLSQEYETQKNSSIEELFSKPVAEIAKPAVFVPETMHIDDLLKDFQKRHVHIAIVVDEHGTARGLVTLEDLIEEVVGEIVDETDLDDNLIERIDKHTIIVDPRLTIGRLNAFFNTNFTAARQKTIGWLVLKEFGKIPDSGDKVNINGYECIVEEAEDHRIKRLKIIRTAKARMQ